MKQIALSIILSVVNLTVSGQQINQYTKQLVFE